MLMFLTLKRLKREMRVWKSVAHTNIVPFLGYIIEGEDSRFSASLLSPWYPNGNLGVPHLPGAWICSPPNITLLPADYLRNNPGADKKMLVS